MFIEHFADGSDDCPLILLYGCEPEVVARLRHEVQLLAAGSVDRVAVHDIPGFVSVDGCRLFASVATWDSGTRPLSEPRTFECCLRPLVWDNVEGLLESFTLASGSNGLQWLDNHGELQLLISGHRGW